MLLPRLLQARREDIQRADPKTNTCIYIYVWFIHVYSLTTLYSSKHLLRLIQNSFFGVDLAIWRES